MSKRTSARIKKALAELEGRKEQERQEIVDIVLTDPDEPSEPPSYDPINDNPPWDEELEGKGKKRITLIRDHTLDYPELYLEVYIAGSSYEERMFAEMFSRARCTRATSLEEADLCVFTGGVDVDSRLYRQTRHPTTSISTERDKEDMKTYSFCLDKGIPMFGVCRGMQFLHVMNYGSLFQDIDNHVGDHSIFCHETKRHIDRVSSVHHQVCRPNRDAGMVIVATANKSRNRWINEKERHKGPNIDIEALFYRETCCFGVQGHPEYSGYNQYTVWTLERLYEFVMLNPDVDWVNGARRIKPDILAQRKAEFAKVVKTRGVLA